MNAQKTFLFLIVLFISTFNYGQSIKPELQSNYNLEQTDKITNRLIGLIEWGAGYKIIADSTVKYSGKYSMRIEPMPDEKDRQFGCGVFKIPAIFAGNRIELQGFIKLENVENGNAGLFMRIDGKAGLYQMDNMLNRNINGTKEWAKISLSLPLSKGDKNIFFGAILSGTGKLWVDDFKILVDGKELSQTKEKVEIIYKAQLDTSFVNGSKIILENLSKSKTEDLAVVGKIWGYLKYYHPAIATGDINWDFELFRIIPLILNTESKEERNKSLLRWINSLGTVSENYSMDLDEDRIKLLPDLEWIEDQHEFGSEIVKKLNEIKRYKRSNKNYYVDFIEGVRNPIFENEESYLKQSNPDDGYALLSLFRYWNIIQYYFPYKNLIEEDWNKVLLDFIPEFINSKSTLDYQLTLLKLIVKIKDTHANIWGNDRFLFEYRGKYMVPCRISFIENKAVVTDAYSDIDSSIQLKVGDIIEKIDGEKVEIIVKNKSPYYSASNYPRKLKNIGMDLLRSNNDVITLHINRSGKQFVEVVNTSKLEAVYSKYQTEKYSWKIIDEQIGYLYPGSLKKGEILEIGKHLNKYKGLVIDLRCYPSDFIVFSLSEYLMPAPIQFVKFSQTTNELPGLFLFSSPLAVGKNNPDYFKGKVVIIVNETTISQAEYTTMAFRTGPNAKVIGSTTAGADGNVSQFTLPGGISTMISGIGVYYPDGTETQGIGIVPDIEIKPTLKGIIDGKDELLEKAIRIIKEDK